MGRIMKTVVRLAGAVVLGLGATVQAGGPTAGVACPQCDLDGSGTTACVLGSLASVSQSSFGFDSIYDTPSKLCLKCPAGLNACNQGGVVTPSSCTDLSSPIPSRFLDENCGSCGRKCSGDQPHCVSGTCGCRATLVDGLDTLCGLDRFCSAGSTCAKCQEGFANCNLNSESGGPSDCEVNINSNVTNCGACGNICPPGHTCSNGRCTCGSNSMCTYPKDVCSNGQCVECASPSDNPVKCRSLTPSESAKFCDVPQKACAECPTGFADCNATNLVSLPDTGAISDCETQINENGFSQNCGACGLTCGDPATPAQSCCSGTCKCGKFANNASPTNGECAAALQCSEREYCDQALGKCMPLLPFSVTCQRNAVSPSSDDDLTNLPLCGSCNRAEALASGIIVNSTCLASDPKNCGRKGNECRKNQRCDRGKCTCAIDAYNVAMKWKPFIDRDSDRDNKIDINGMPVSGCSDTIVSPLLIANFEKINSMFMGFMSCASKLPVPVTQVTSAQFRDPAFRATICPGGAGLCPRAFCEETFNNMTGSPASAFCSVMDKATRIIKKCTQSYRPVGESTGDLTCANNYLLGVLQVLGSLPTTSASFFEFYNFLGCDRQRDDMTLYDPTFSGPVPDVPMYRYETAQALLGSSRIQGISIVVILLASIACLHALGAA